MSKYLAILAACIVTLVLLFVAPSSGGDLEDISKLITSVNDPKMTATDMAFFLATHNYDAMPEKDHVDLKVDGKIYELIPDRSDQGLFTVIPLKEP